MKGPTMNCVHCASTPAVASCATCGAGACSDHARVVAVPGQLPGLVPARAATRRVLCVGC